MLTQLMSNIDRGSPRNLNRWQKFLTDLNRKIGIRENRFRLASPQNSGIVRLISSLIGDVRTRYLLTLKDDLDRYFTGVAERSDMSARFDTAVRGSTYAGLVYADDDVSEVIVPAHQDNILDNLPLDAGWTTWERVWEIPLDILFTDARDVPADLIGDSITSKHPPEVAGFSINLPVLIMKWLAFVRTGNMIESPTAHTQFIHLHVVGPLMRRLVDFWILKVLRETIYSLYTLEPADTVVDDLVPRWMPKNSALYGIRELRETMDELRDGGRIEDLLITPLLLGGRNLADVDHEIRFSRMMPRSGEYDHLRFLTRCPWTELIYAMHALNGNSAGNDVGLKNSLHEFRRTRQRSLENRIEDPELRGFYEAQISKLDGNSPV